MPNALGLLSQDELAELLGVTKGTLREWRRQNKGPDYLRVEKTVFYRQKDVEDWLGFKVVFTNRTEPTRPDPDQPTA